MTPPVRATPLRLGAALVGLLISGLGLGWLAGGQPRSTLSQG